MTASDATSLPRRRRYGLWLLVLVMLGVALAAAFAWGAACIQFRVFPYRLLLSATGRSGGGESGALDERTDYHRTKKTFFEELGQEAEVVMIGDSLTDGCEWRELFPGLRIVNRGVGQDVSGAVLDRMAGIVATRAKLAFVLIGAQDFSRGASVAEVQENYRQIVTALRQAGMTVYVQSTLPGRTRYAALNDRIAQLNADLVALAASEVGVEYLDLAAVLAAQGSLEQRYSRDEIHLTAEGYARWRDLLKPIFVQHGLVQ